MAAVEFAFLAPIMVVMLLTLVEVTLRYEAVEKFHRYVSQAGDLVSRSPSLTTAEIDAIYGSATKVMKPVPVGENMTITVTSIGFDSTGTPKLLWQRTEPETADTLPVDVADAAGLGSAGETVIRTDARFFYASYISHGVGLEEIELNRKMYFRPRSSRVVTMDGKVSENGADWDDIPVS